MVITMALLTKKVSRLAGNRKRIHSIRSSVLLALTGVTTSAVADVDIAPSISANYVHVIEAETSGQQYEKILSYIDIGRNEGAEVVTGGEKESLNDDLDSGFEKSQKHAGELTPRKDVYLSVDGFQQGVGSINSWGALPLEKYLLPYASYQYSYWIVPIK